MLASGLFSLRFVSAHMVNQVVSQHGGEDDFVSGDGNATLCVGDGKNAMVSQLDLSV